MATLELDDAAWLLQSKHVSSRQTLTLSSSTSRLSQCGDRGMPRVFSHTTYNLHQVIA